MSPFEKKLLPVLFAFDWKKRYCVRPGYLILIADIWMISMMCLMFYILVGIITEPWSLQKIWGLFLAISIDVFFILAILFFTIHMDILDTKENKLLIYRPLFRLEVPIEEIHKILVENPPEVNRFRIIFKIHNRKVIFWMHNYFPGTYGFIQRLYITAGLPYPTNISEMKIYGHRVLMKQRLPTPADIENTQ